MEFITTCNLYCYFHIIFFYRSVIDDDIDDSSFDESSEYMAETGMLKVFY